jgi:poly(hydroxyalkanoate) depolymerase family esterase
MSIYVPDRLATRPPILVASHYCGGSAAALFGQAQGGGLVRAADQYGFIMVFPQAANPDGSGRCWDVGSTRALTRDGGGDTHAVAQMVEYTIRRYGANPDRVYAIGTSSGAMMTQALLALYPDVFKAGAEFAGVPAGCWAVGASADGTWSGPCAGGSVSRSAAEWGELVRRMNPGYGGQRPRVQLWHGDADTTIRYQNHLEAIKQWTNVLGLGTTATSTTTLTYGTHQWTRERWKDECGFVVLDAWTEHSGAHGVPDANMNAQYTIPFLGLDDAGPVDPHVSQCEGGASSSSGSSGSSTGGGSGASSSGAGGSSSSGGGSSGSAGGSSTGGASSSGGVDDGRHDARLAQGAGCSAAPLRPGASGSGADVALLTLWIASFLARGRKQARR